MLEDQVALTNVVTRGGVMKIWTMLSRFSSQVKVSQQIWNAMHVDAIQIMIHQHMIVRSLPLSFLTSGHAAYL